MISLAKKMSRDIYYSLLARWNLLEDGAFLIPNIIALQKQRYDESQIISRVNVTLCV